MAEFQKIKIDNIEYNIIDAIQDFRAEDSFIHRSNKLAQFDGNGESKKHVGTYNGELGQRISNFFDYSTWGLEHIDNEKKRKTINSARESGAVIFGSDINHEIDKNFDTFNIQTKSDFYYLLCNTQTNVKSSDTYKNVLKGEIKIEKGIKALEHLYCMCYTYISPKQAMFEKRKCFYEALQISDTILKSGIVPECFKTIQIEFLIKKLPNSYKDLSINGADLLAQGFKGTEIGQKLKEELYKELSK